MFWRVELDKSGAILTCDLVQEQGRNGGKVIFVEAETKAEACSGAKAWYARRLEVSRSNGAARRARRMADGKCVWCAAEREPQRRRVQTCCACAEKLKARSKARSLGLVESRDMPDPDLAKAKYLAGMSESRRRRAYASVSLVGMLERFDRVGPDAFRQWLASEVERRTGGLAPDFESALDAYDPLAQAAE